MAPDTDSEKPTNSTETFAVSVFHLDYEDQDAGYHERARDLLGFGLEDPDGTTLLDLETLVAAYERVGQDEIEAEGHDEALGKMWHGWNSGSGQERSAFRSAKVRSLSAGDVLVVEDTGYFIKKYGFAELDLTISE